MTDEHGLRCPGCGTSMDEVDVRGVKIDRCSECLGLYFDAGEFADAARCQVPPLEVRQTSERRCPRCARAMHLAKFGPAVVDWCEPCRGIYLDVGEFEIILRGRAPVPTKDFDRWQKQKPATAEEIFEFLGTLAD